MDILYIGYRHDIKLMKYVFNAPQTYLHVSNWAYDERFINEFWNLIRSRQYYT